MSVYVDDMEAPLGRLIMCHMIADTHDELVQMAEAIEVSTRWIQHPGSQREHFDICKAKRARAVELGAIEIGQRDLARRLIERHGFAALDRYYQPNPDTHLPALLGEPEPLL